MSAAIMQRRDAEPAIAMNDDARSAELLRCRRVAYLAALQLVGNQENALDPCTPWIRRVPGTPTFFAWSRISYGTPGVVAAYGGPSPWRRSCRSGVLTRPTSPPIPNAMHRPGHAPGSHASVV